MKRQKFVNLIVMTLVLVVGLCVVLAACNSKPDANSVPDVVGPSNNDWDTPSDGVAYEELDFQFSMPNSVFKSVEIPYELDKVVQYSIVGRDSDGAEVERSEWKGLTKDLVDESCRALLDEPGHHQIFVTVPRGNGTLKGSFSLHLMRNAQVTQWVTVLFDLGDGATAAFGVVEDGKVSFRLSTDLATFASWAELTDFFSVARSGYKLVAYQLGEDIELKDDTALEEKIFPVTFGEANETVTLTAKWERDLVNVEFDLNLPAMYSYPHDAEGNLVDENGEPVYKYDEKVGDPVEWFNRRYDNVQVEKKRGRIPEPNKSDLNMFNGLSFGGWFTAKYTVDEDGNSVVERNADGTVVLDRAWNFNATVEDSDIKLFAKWNETTYNFTLYTKGGTFKSNVQSLGGVPQGFTEITAQSIFMVTGVLTRIEFSGFKYNIPIDNYVVKLQLNAGGDTAYVYFKDIYNNFASSGLMTKGDGEYLVSDGLYGDNRCTSKLTFEEDEEDGRVYLRKNSSAYVKWVFNASDDPTTNDDRMSRWFTEVLFRGEGQGYELKGDGTVRIKQCMDEDVNEMIIPAYIDINGSRHAVTEIADNAIDNMISLTTLDLSGATNLQRIGAQAFLRCSNLSKVITDNEEGANMLSSLQYVGKEAFKETEFEDNYSENNYGKQFIIFNTILYKYVGKQTEEGREYATDLVMSDAFYTVDDLTFPEGDGAEVKNALTAAFNEAIANIMTIVQGAFSQATSLTSLTVTDKVTTIENGAFAGVKSIREIKVNDGKGVYDEADNPSGYRLSYIGESAFDDGAAILGANSGNLVDKNSIVIGAIYYRIVDRAATSAHIGKNIVYIAPYAFKGASNLAEITFDAPESIKVIGKYAFIDTAYIQRESGVYQDDTGAYLNNTYVKDGYTVIGGKLVAHASNDIDLVLPNYGEMSINENAFGARSAFARTLRFGANVAYIGAGAFYEAKNLKTLIMNEIGVDGDKLVGAPMLDDNAFLDGNGNMIDGLRLFLRESVIDFLTEANAEDVTDPVTLQWVRLYEANPDKFYTERIENIRVNGNVLVRSLLRTNMSGEEGNAFLDLYAVTDGKYTDGKFSIADALYVMSNTGIARYEALSDEMNFEFVKLEGVGDGSYEEYYIRFVYQDVQYTTYSDLNYGADGQEAADSVTATATNFTFLVYKAIKADGEEKYRPFNSSDRYDTAADTIPSVSRDIVGKSIWMTGVDNDPGTSGNANGFRYWSSHATFDFQFHYIDVDGEEHVIKNAIGESGELLSSNITALDDKKQPIRSLPRTINGTAISQSYTVYLVVDFYGLGKVMFKFDYTVQKPLFSAIEQPTAISMPLNADGVREFATYKLDLVRQDGYRTQIDLRNGNNGLRFEEGAIDTRHVGINSVQVVYQSDNVATSSRTLTLDVYYIVTLEAYIDQFDYRITEEFDEPEADAYGNEVWGKAIITGVKAGSSLRSAETIVIPSVYSVTTDGVTKLYKISAIGENGSSSGGNAQAKGVFEDFTALRSVYLSSNLEAIYVRAFSGCTNLQDIYTAQRTTAEGKDFAGEYEVVGEQYEVTEETGEGAVTYKQTDVIIKSVTKDMYESVGEDRVELVINSIYDIADSEFGEKQRIRIVGIHSDGLTLPEPDPISGDPLTRPQINVYMPDTVAGKVLVYDYLGNVLDDDFDDIANLWFYAVDQYKFRVFERLNANLKYIDNFVFRDCKSLDALDFSESKELAYIGPRAFGGTGIKEIDLSETQLQIVNNDTFRGCTALESVVLPDTVYAIGLNAFDGCTALISVVTEGKENITLNKTAGTTQIQLNAFNNCSSLTELRLDSESIDVISDSVFTGCNALTIYLSGSVGSRWGRSWNRLATSGNLLNVPYVTGDTDVASDGYIYYVDEETGLRYRLNKTSGEAALATQAYMIPQDIRIPAFITYTDSEGAKNYNVTEVGDSAFAGNNRLLSVTVSSNNNLFYIRNRAFADCVELQSFAFEESEDNNHLTYVDSTAFLNTPRLLRAPDVAPNFSYNGFRFSITQNASIMSYLGVRTAEGNYPTSVTIPETINFNGRVYNVVGIDANAFNTEAGHALTSITFTQYVALISAYAFDGCEALANIAFADGASPAQFTGVDMRAFSGTALTTAYVNSGDMLYRVTYGESNEATLIKYSGSSFDLTLPLTVSIEREKDSNSAAYDVTGKGTIEVPITQIFTSAISGKLATLTVSRDITIKNNDEDAFPTVADIASQCYYRSEATGIIYEMFDANDGDYAKEAHIYSYIDGLGLNNIELPATIPFDGEELNITIIHSGAFANAVELDTLTLNCNGLRTIEANAFAGCLSLTEIILPANISQIDETAFSGCTALTVYCNFADGKVNGNWKDAVPVVFDFNNGTKKASDGLMYATHTDGLRYAFDKEKGEAYVTVQPYNFKASGEIDIPEQIEISGNATVEDGTYRVVAIKANAFRSNTTIGDVKLPAGLTTIEANAFDGSTLSNLLFAGANGLTSVDEHAFDNTVNIMTVYYTLDGFLYEMSTSGLHNASVVRFFGTPTEGTGIINVPAVLNYLDSEYTVTDVKDGAFAAEAIKIIIFNADLTVPESELNKDGRQYAIVLGGVVYYIDKLSGSDAKIVAHARANYAESDTITILSSVSFNGGTYEVNVSADMTGLESVVNVEFTGHVTMDEGALEGKDLFYLDSGNVKYQLFDGEANTATAVGFVSPIDGAPNYQLVINATISFNNSTYNVTKIGDGAFEGNTFITSVLIKYATAPADERTPATYNLTELGARAFANCINITEFVFEGGQQFAGRTLRKVGESAMLGMDKLNEVYAVLSDVLYKLTKSDGSASILSYVGEGTEAVIDKEIDLGEGRVYTVTELGPMSFDNSSIESITVYSDFKVWGDLNIKIYYVANDIVYRLDAEGDAYKAVAIKVDDRAENAVTALDIVASITFDENEYVVSEIGEGAFKDNTDVTTVTFADGEGVYSIVKIGANAFENMTGITDILIPSSVTYVGDNAFAGCNALTIRCDFAADKASSFGSGWSGSCPVVYAGSDTASDGKMYATVDGLRYELIKDGNTATLIRQSTALTGEITVNSVINVGEERYTVTAVADGAFSGIAGITSIYLANSIVSIGAGAFKGCASLTTVNFNWESLNMLALNSIAEDAFDECPELTGRPAYVDNVLYWIDEQASSAIYLRYFGEDADIVFDELDVRLGESNYTITYIISSAFGEGVQSVTVDNRVTLFGDLSALSAKLYYIEQSDGASYKWQIQYEGESASAYLASYTPAESVAELDFVLPATVFFNNAEHGVTKVLAGAFGESTLKSFTFSATVTFEGSYGSAEIFFTDEAGGGKYRLDPDRTAIVVGLADPDDSRDLLTILSAISFNGEDYPVNVIAEGAFEGATNIVTVNIPASIRRIEKQAFANCSALNAFIIPQENQLEFIASDAFDGSSLTEERQPKVAEGKQTFYIDTANGIRYLLSASEYTAVALGFNSGEEGRDAVVIVSSFTYLHATVTVVGVAEGAFEDNTNITSVTIADTVKRIEARAFAGTTALNTFTYNGEEPLDHVAEDAFEGSSLPAEQIPQSKESAAPEEE